MTPTAPRTGRAGASWVDACAGFGRERAALDCAIEALDAFRSAWPRGGPAPPPEPPWDGPFEALERAILAGGQLDGAAEQLAGEVDPAQAAMFERRLRAVDGLLAELADQGRPEGRILRVGLRVRLAGIRAAPGPRALRVRALADFHHSVLGTVRHRLAGSPGATLEEAAAALRWEEVARGIELAVLQGPLRRIGPAHAGLLRVAPGAVRFEAVDRRGREGSPLADEVTERGAVAAVSGGFFLYSEPDIEPPHRRFDPVGLLVCGRRVVSPPLLRRGALLAGADGRVELRVVGPEDCPPSVDGRPLGRAAVEGRSSTRAGAAGRPLGGAVEVWTRARGRTGPDEPSVAVAGDRVVAAGRSLPVPLAGGVLPVSPPLPEVGARVDWPLPELSDGSTAVAAIAGGPMLLRGGEPRVDLRAEDFWGTAPPVTFSQDETGDRFLLPRLAAGLDARGRLLLVAVDGRNPGRALGATLADTAALMAALGCRVALNLDGGSSKRMVAGGRVVDLPSTEVVTPGAPPSVRPVHTALLLFSRT